MAEAFEQTAVAMFGYMTELDKVAIDASQDRTFNMEGHDWDSLMFHFLDELLVEFHISGFIVKDIKILEFDEASFKVKVAARGEKFSLDKHPQGTEVKAITYSNMQIHTEPDEKGLYNTFVIVDI